MREVRALLRLFYALYELFDWIASRNDKPEVKQSGAKFYSSQAWRKLRYEVLRDCGRKCIACGRTPPDVVLHVDHVKPRSLYPELALDRGNLVVMCADCNIGKSNKCEHDFRLD